MNGAVEALGHLARPVQRRRRIMANKTNRKLALKKETLRTLNAQQLQAVVGAGLSGIYCTVGQASLGCGSTTVDYEYRDGVYVKISG